jgi:hypothetical protein
VIIKPDSAMISWSVLVSKPQDLIILV